jgi:putative copper resistance protein D
VDSWLHPLTRFVHFAVLLGLFGATAFRCIGLRKAVNQSGRFPAATIVFAAMAPLVSALLMLIAVGAMMGQPFWSLDAAVVQAMVTTTSFGTSFIIRSVLLLCALGVLLANRRTSASWPVAAALYGAALITLPWSGHAAAGEGGAGLVHRLNDALHVIAAGLWVGAIGWFSLLTAKAHRNRSEVAALTLLDAMHGFAPLGIGLVFVVALTGVINAHLIFGLGNSVAVLGTTYGRLLAIKIGLVGVMLLCAVRHGTPRKKDRSALTDDASVVAVLRGSLAAELAVASLVIGVAALLGLTSPMG